MAERSSETAASTIEQLAANVTSKPVLLGVETAQMSDLHPNEPGLSYLAKRLYVQSGYPEKQALKAAMMLSALFMRATGDPDVVLHAGDALSIMHDGALLIRTEGGVAKEYKVSFPETLARQSRVQHQQQVISTAHSEETALREVVPNAHLTAVNAFLNDTQKLRLALRDFSMVASSPLLAPDDAVRHRVLSSEQKNAFPGYYFGQIFYGTDTSTPACLLVAVHPTTGKVIFCAGSDGRRLAETTTAYLVQPLGEVAKSYRPSVREGTISHSSTSELVKPNLRMQLQTTLREVLNRNFILENKSLPHFGIEAYTITFEDQPGREFYLAASQKGATTKYRLSERSSAHTGQMNDTTIQNWTTNFDTVVEKLRVA